MQRAPSPPMTAPQALSVIERAIESHRLLPDPEEPDAENGLRGLCKQHAATKWTESAPGRYILALPGKSLEIGIEKDAIGNDRAICRLIFFYRNLSESTFWISYAPRGDAWSCEFTVRKGTDDSTVTRLGRQIQDLAGSDQYHEREDRLYDRGHVRLEEWEVEEQLCLLLWRFRNPLPACIKPLSFLEARGRAIKNVR